MAQLRYRCLSPFALTQAFKQDDNTPRLDGNDCRRHDQYNDHSLQVSSSRFDDIDKPAWALLRNGLPDAMVFLILFGPPLPVWLLHLLERVKTKACKLDFEAKAFCFAIFILYCRYHKTTFLWLCKMNQQFDLLPSTSVRTLVHTSFLTGKAGTGKTNISEKIKRGLPKTNDRCSSHR